MIHQHRDERFYRRRGQGLLIDRARNFHAENYKCNHPAGKRPVHNGQHQNIDVLYIHLSSGRSHCLSWDGRFIACNPIFLSTDDVRDEMLFPAARPGFPLQLDTLVFQDQVAIPHQFSSGRVCSKFILGVKKHCSKFYFNHGATARFNIVTNTVNVFVTCSFWNR